MNNPNRERNFDLIRLILLRVESSSPDSLLQPPDLNIEGYDPRVVVLHVEMLKDAGFIEAEIINMFSGNSCLIRKILWEGYEFLDSAKNDNIWKKFKAEAEKKGSSMSMAVVNGVLTAIAKKHFNLD